MTDVDRARTGFARALGFLAALGIAHATEEWTPRLALHRVGRDPFTGALPHALAVASFACAVALVVGRRPRAAALGCCAALAALHALAPSTYHNNYYLLWLLLAAVAVDSPKEPQWSSSGVPLVIRLARAQIAAVYLISVAAKLAHPWWRSGGGVVRWIVTERAPQSGAVGLVNPALAPLLSRPPLAAAAQSAVLAVELLLPLALYSARLRRGAFVVGALMHAVMQEWLFPQLFTFLMLLGYHAFGPLGTRAWTLSAPPGHLTLRALAALDVFSRARAVEDPGASSPTLTTPDGTVHTGPAALWWLAVITPAGVLAWAALSLAAPGTDSVLTMPRAAVENALVIAVGAVGLLPGKRPSHRPPA